MLGRDRAMAGGDAGSAAVHEEGGFASVGEDGNQLSDGLGDKDGHSAGGSPSALSYTEGVSPVGPSQRRIMRLLGLCLFLVPFFSLFAVGRIDETIEMPSVFHTRIFSSVYACFMFGSAILFIAYRGYALIDDLVSTAGGIFVFLLVAFPSVSGEGQDRVGFLQVPLEPSFFVHCIAMCLWLLCGCFLFNCCFTRMDGKPTRRKRMRNALYVACGYASIIFFMLRSAASAFGTPDYHVMLFLEILGYVVIGLGWLVKGGMLLRDKAAEASRKGIVRRRNMDKPSANAPSGVSEAVY